MPGNSPGDAAPWAAPAAPLKAIKWMFQRHAPPGFVFGGTSSSRNGCGKCYGTRHQPLHGKQRADGTSAEDSRDCLKALRAETNIQYEGRQGGTLQLFRTEQHY
ncbi:hypothetical protein ACLK1Z_07055 [Escherichia coli]